MTINQDFLPPSSFSRGAKWAAAGAVALAAAGLIVRQQTKFAERKYPPQGSFVTAHGSRLHYVEKGKGQAVVFLHGNGVMLEDMQLSGLLDRAAHSYRAIAFDRHGFGHSDRPRGTLWSASEQASALVAAFAKLDIERPIVFGHSFAAQVALALALDHPTKITGVVLASGYYYPSGRADVVLFSPPAIPVVGDVLSHTVAPLIGQMMAPKMLKDMFAPREVPPHFTQFFPFGLMFRPSQIQSASEDAVTMIPTSIAFQKRYSEILCPIAIVTGDGDKVVDFKTQSQRLHEELPASSLEIVAGAGHMVHHADDAAAILRAVKIVAEGRAAAGAETLKHAALAPSTI